MSTPESAIAPEGLTLDAVVSYWAGIRPEQAMLEYDASYGRGPVTWGECDGYINGAAHHLRESLKRGDTVGIVCDDSVEFHVLINALWRCGVAVLLINRTWGTAVVRDLLLLTECRMLFCNDRTVAARQLPLPATPFPGLRQSPSPFEGLGGKADDVAMLATTSGTTDSPKCVAITHRMIRSAYRTCLRIHDLRRVRKTASLFPLNGIGVMGVCFLLAREVGACTFVFPPFSIANIGNSWEQLVHGRIDFVYLVPPMVRLLNALPSADVPRQPLLAFCASAPVQYQELRRLEAKFPVVVYNAYGLTEMTFAVFFGCRDEDGGATDSIGTPRGIEARIHDADGQTIAGAGVGELYLKGSMLTAGYLRNPSETAASWKDGWLRTGDLAERDANDRYYIRGRLKDSVVRGGVLYYLHELEHYLRQAPNVVDACAFKGRDLPSGDELCVVVHVDRPTSRSLLLEWVRENIGEEKVPNALFVWDRELPRNSNGKVMRNVLAETYRNGELR